MDKSILKNLNQSISPFNKPKLSPPPSNFPSISIDLTTIATNKSSSFLLSTTHRNYNENTPFNSANSTSGGLLPPMATFTVPTVIKEELQVHNLQEEEQEHQDEQMEIDSFESNEKR